MPFSTLWSILIKLRNEHTRSFILMDLIYRTAGGSIAAFVITVLLLKFLPGEKFLLGHDRGRKYAQGSAVNIGKPTGVGFYFTMTFAIASGIACYFSPSLICALTAIVASMMTGFLDDRSKQAWDEYLKGFLDFVMSLFGAFVCVWFYGSDFMIERWRFLRAPLSHIIGWR